MTCPQNLVDMNGHEPEDVATETGSSSFDTSPSAPLTVDLDRDCNEFTFPTTIRSSSTKELESISQKKNGNNSTTAERFILLHPKKICHPLPVSLEPSAKRPKPLYPRTKMKKKDVQSQAPITPKITPEKQSLDNLSKLDGGHDESSSTKFEIQSNLFIPIHDDDDKNEAHVEADMKDFTIKSSSSSIKHTSSKLPNLNLKPREKRL